MKLASFTCDLEPDCPPYLRGFRGIEEGLPKLLDMLASHEVLGTFFTTGEVAYRFPKAVEAVVAAGHELGCHGMTHRSFGTMTRLEASAEITESARILRSFAPVTSFRAPYLTFPENFLDLLVISGFKADSSQGIYKLDYQRSQWSGAYPPLRRIPASLTSSALRLPRVARQSYLRALQSPVVLFTHPWEFVDLTRQRLRYDCRFRTGTMALQCVGDVLAWLQRRDAVFQTIRQLAAYS